MARYVVPRTEIRAKYGSWAAKVLEAVDALGPVVDVSNRTPDQIRQTILGLPQEEAVCLVGGYGLVPPFYRPNPTRHLSGDNDAQIPTDTPYAADPARPADEYSPPRAICRIPDGATADAAGFLKALSFQQEAATTATGPGSFEEGAAEFSGAIAYVHSLVPGALTAPLLSPPSVLSTPGLTGLITGKGRVHILLHGSDRSPDWAYLFGRDGAAPAGEYPRALSARILDLCDLRGAMVTFSSCYAAMLDSGVSEAPARTEGNQVALACLGHGAKAVFGATRSNWIDLSPPYDGFGPGLVAFVWRELAAGQPAAEALRRGRKAYLKQAFAGPQQERVYAMKTVLQFQCYGHPEARL